VMAHITKSSMENQDIVLPNLDIQFKVSDILHTIDEKIKTNEKINRNLLDQAVNIFSNMIWYREKNGVIGDYCIMKSGFAFKSTWWTDKGTKVIKIGDINQDNLNLNSCSCVEDDKLDKAKDFIVNAGDLVLAMTGATIGKFAMIPESNETVLVNQRVGKFFLGAKPLKKLPFIYCTLKQNEVYSEIIGRGQGSAQPNISANDVMTIPCVIPSQDEIDGFNDIAEPMFKKIVKNQNENIRLATLRDSLLPKLMSGELDVSELKS
ncbi:MAG: restriction endonuclease subunit S, partial [Erysipelotrichia bacterium]|nr:restriction endonuclease subunit S [Erysipelotrichia bacterium]